MKYRRSLQESPLNNSEMSKRFLHSTLSSVAIGRINKKMESRLARCNIPLSKLSEISLALYPPQQHLSTEYVLNQYKVPTYHTTLRTRFISPTAPPISNIRLRDFIFRAVCPIHMERVYRIDMFKPEHSIALVHYIYTHEVSPIVGSLLGVVIVGITEEDLRQPKVNWDPTVLLMMQTKTERELDDVGVGIIAFSKTASRLGMCCEDIWDALNLAWNLLLRAHPDGGRRSIDDWIKLCEIKYGFSVNFH
ncbi:hypothetical protein ARMSODRAFT_671837 [Armillaria solidipes]|uniref:Uncharacterized protein n=1 Tax=Armillaria solidipes TaxID=1076256 RepID=A0A2H3B2A4_9AGAR|nr:hypothetical protein ARMSODRAFT_671837 [Armillaria solidipes]